MSQTQTEPKGVSTTNRSPGTPHWVKVFGIIALVLILLFAVLHFSGGHGPSSHIPPIEHSEQSMPDGGHTP